MLGAMDLHQPDENAYGRVTNSERYQVVVDEARRLLEELARRPGVERVTATAADDFPDWADGDAVSVRLTPSQGAPVAFLFTDFPGVVIRAGNWGTQSFPICGCDACDEAPEDVVERLRTLIDAVVDGRVTEEVGRRSVTHVVSGEWGSLASERRLERGESRRLGGKQKIDWPPWPEP